MEVYSEVWVKITCRYDVQQKNEIGRAWKDLLAKYAKYGIVDDTQGAMFQQDGINFGIGADDRRSDRPDYEKQYQAFGEFIKVIQYTLGEWELNIHVQKTGGSG